MHAFRWIGGSIVAAMLALTSSRAAAQQPTAPRPAGGPTQAAPPYQAQPQFGQPLAGQSPHVAPQLGQGPIRPVQYEEPQTSQPAVSGDHQWVSTYRLEELNRRIESLEKAAIKAPAKEEADDCAPLCPDGTPAKKVDLLPKSVKVGGRIVMDYLMFDQDDANKALVGDEENAISFDTVRIRVEGDIWDFMDYRVEMEFEGGEVDFKDAYITQKEIPYVDTLRVGHMKEPFGLEQQESALVLTFMERSLCDEAVFVPGRNTGARLGGDILDDKTFSAWTGTFATLDPDNPPGYGSDASTWSWTSRVVWLPYYSECAEYEGRYLAHVGAGYSWRPVGRNPRVAGFPDHVITFSQRPELGGGTASNNPDPLQNPGNWLSVTLNTDEYSTYNLEALSIWGPLSFQAEYFWLNANNLAGPDKFYSGYYAYVSYFLTGENRGYKLSEKCPDRVKPFEKMFLIDTIHGICHGCGAWEVGVRYSNLDLEDGGVGVAAGEEGEMQNITCGVNWYLNDYSRMMFNYSHSDLERVASGQGSANLFGMRYQVEF